MSLHADAQALLEAWVAPDAAQERLRQRYVAHLRSHPDGTWRECRPDHLTASTLVLDADRSAVLLTLHAKARRWFQVGGHCERDDQTLAGAALREAREESGVPDLVILPVPVQLSEHPVPFCGPDGDVHHLDVRFVAVAPRASRPEVSEESLDVRWWPLDALPDLEPDVLQLVELALSRARRPAADPGGPRSTSR